MFILLSTSTVAARSASMIPLISRIRGIIESIAGTRFRNLSILKSSSISPKPSFISLGAGAEYNADRLSEPASDSALRLFRLRPPSNISISPRKSCRCRSEYSMFSAATLILASILVGTSKGPAESGVWLTRASTWLSRSPSSEAKSILPTVP
ncbi:hypothetical protein IMSAGC008_02258 [Muribaculaceae bacterium]|nr:hypothetical protein IMSAGC008_02258 [Muribaculaceae bacterium]